MNIENKIKTENTEKVTIQAKTNNEIKAKTELNNKSEANEKSKLLTLAKLHATSKMQVETHTQGFRVPRGYVMIKGNGNLCIKTARNQRISQAMCNGNKSVMWTFIKYRGRYIIQNRNGYVLDNYAFKRNNGGPIYAWKRNNKNNQRWSIINLGGGRFALRGNHSGKCLDNTGKARKGALYHQWTCNRRNKNQHFRIAMPMKFPKVPIPSGYIQIQGPKNLCIHAVFHKPLKQGPCNSSKSALWRFNKKGNSYIIQNKEGQVMDVFRSKTGNRVPIWGWNRSNAANQKWNLILKKGTRKGYYLMRNLNSGKCLETRGGARSGKGYQQNPCVRSSNREFRIIPARSKHIKRKNNKSGKKKKKMSAKALRRMRKNNSSGKKGKAPRGWGLIRGKGGLCIKSSKNKRITQGRCRFKNMYLWRFVKMGKTYVVQNRSGYVLDNYAFKKNNGGPIFAWRRNNKKNQKWYYLKVGRGRFELQGLHSGKCIDNTGKAKIGRGYHQWACSSANSNQHFRFIRKRSSRRRKGSRRSNRRRGSRRRGSRRRGSRRSNGRRGSRKSNSGYRKRKNVRFLGGRYKFNLITGKKFCMSKCKPNRTAPVKKCFKGSVVNCNSCVYTGAKKDPLGKDSDLLCRSMCNAISNEKTCEFYTFIDDRRKVINKKLLNRFGRIFIRKYLRR